MLNDIYLNFNATLYAFEGYELPLIITYICLDLHASIDYYLWS